MKGKLILLGAMMVVASLGSTALATSYASGIQNLGGGNYSFVLNEASPQVIIERTGDTPLYLGALPKGAQTFNIGAGSAFNIKAYTNTAPAWTQISVDQTSTNFNLPLGISVNKHPWSPNFGKAYVSNALAATTTAGRVTSDGVYMLTADTADVGVATGGVTWTGNSSPFKSTIGPDDHLYVDAFSQDLAYEFSGDMSTATPLIDATNKSQNTYGTVTYTQYVASICVEGTQAGGDRKIYLVDQNYYGGNPGRKGLIQYNLGGNAAATTGDLGTQYIGPNYYSFYPMDVARDADGDWYLNQFRYSPNQAFPVSKFADGAPPINTAVWESNKTVLAEQGAYGIDVNDNAGYVAYGQYYTGFVYILDKETGLKVAEFDAGSRLRDVAFDAAGNIYTIDNTLQYLRVWSPGGSWMASTGSDGTFALLPEPATLSLLALGALALLRRR